MKIKWVEPKEDDPIFKSGFVISPIKSQIPKKASKSLNKKRVMGKEEENKKKGGLNPPYISVQRLSCRMVIP